MPRSWLGVISGVSVRALVGKIIIWGGGPSEADASRVNVLSQAFKGLSKAKMHNRSQAVSDLGRHLVLTAD